MTGSQIRTQLTRLVDGLVLSMNPTVLDDDQPDLLADPEKRLEAVDQLKSMIEFYREDL